MSSQQSGANDRGDPEAGEPTGDYAGDQSATRTLESGDAVAGAVIGAYHLLQPIGHGGMGEVWLAEQREPVRRRVAIKLIKAGMDTREVVARFESERQALALMDHPAIAKVFDAGSTPQGRPYFVMEYVTGIPITEYCDKHKMTPRQRLELFIQVCQGVQHAHQKAIIHRDLKPSNILVGEVDGKPMPRIIDFGVAKATSQQLTAATMFTRAGNILGTPAYMSPEQADLAGADVDTRTDVYSLGVVLYELLVGALPLDFRKAAFEEILRRLREEEAPRPSTRVQRSDEQSSIAAQNRGTDPAALTRQLRGDVDAITLKALEKDRSRRYSAPSELASDIGRYLRNEPVVARPASAAYRARKYIRRHRIGVAIAAAIAVLLISFAVAQTFELRRIARERDRATRERDRADRITDFMTGMFNVSNPFQVSNPVRGSNQGIARGNSITAREILDEASKNIDPGLSKDPELQAQMMQVMGRVYGQLGLAARAHSLFERAAEIRRRVLGPEHPDTLVSMGSLALVLSQEGHYAEAEKLQRQTLDSARRVLGPEHPETLSLMDRLAFDLDQEGRYREAESLYRETFAERRRILGPNDQNTLGVMHRLANTLSHEGRYPEAEKLYRQTLDLDLRAFGPEHPATLLLMEDLGSVLDLEGRYSEAEDVQRQTLDRVRRVLGPEHPETVRAITNLAHILSDQDHYAEAEKLQREALEIRRRVLAPGHPDIAASLYDLACLMALQGRTNDAFALLRDAIEHGLYVESELGLEKDPDLKSLHGDPRFPGIVALAKEQAAAARQAK